MKPVCNQYQHLAALRAWIDPSLPPLAAIQAPSGRAPLRTDGLSLTEGSTPNIAVSCQLALLWAQLAERDKDPSLQEAANRLAGFLLPLVSEKFMTLWTPESEYRKNEALLMRQLFLQGTARDGNLHPGEPCLNDPAIGYELSRSERAAIAVTGSGWQTSLGAARIGDLEVAAFGPHGTPLNQTELFGIGPGEAGWVSLHAAKEVWLRARGAATPGCVTLALDITGAARAFVFYVRAEGCSVGGKILKPQSLTRFSGPVQPIEWTAGQSKVLFTAGEASHLEVIPLAGDDTAWGASFLLAAHLPPAEYAPARFSFALADLAK